MRSTEAGSHEKGATSKGRGASLPARRETLIKEADLQVRAIMRMEAWKRITYSLVAVGALLAYWQAYRDGPAWALVVGVAVLVVSVLASLILYLEDSQQTFYFLQQIHYYLELQRKLQNY